MNMLRNAAMACMLCVAASCGAPSAPAPAAADATQQAKPNAQAVAPTAQLTRATLVGRWGDNGDCTKDIVINADGTFTSYTGGGGTWTLNGDRMSMTGANGVFEVGVEIINGNTLMISNADGSVGTSQRC